MTAVPRTGTHLFLAALSAFAWMTAPAAAAPEDRVVTFQVHEDPAAPESPVRFTFKLRIEPIEQRGDTIGWRVKSVEITKHGYEGDPDSLWVDSRVLQSDSDQLWWVSHANTESPNPKEFIDLPQLVGRATPIAIADKNLFYSLTSNGAIDNSTGEREARATYSLATESNPETPIVEGAEEPVESGGNSDPH